MRILPAFCAFLLTISPLMKAQPSNPDESFSPDKLILPAALIGIGAWGVSNGWYDLNVNQPVRAWAEDLRGECYIHADDYLQFLPAAAYIGLGFVAEGEHTHSERLAVLVTSSVLVAATVNIVKYMVCSMRPDGTTRNAFPSGHTATAMMGAELIRLEYGPWYGAGAYAIALGVAALRIYNNRHWSNDVLGGAAVGILSANAAHWLLPLERKLLGIGNVSLQPAVFPAGEERNYGYGMALSLMF